MKRLAVLVSGRGSNLHSLIDSERVGGLGRCAISLVVSSRRTAPALDRARAQGIPIAEARLRDHPTREAWDIALANTLIAWRIDLVACAGFGLILGPAVLDRYLGRILNVHPSLLPAFGGGLTAPADALAHGVRISGCTVHLVTASLDAGPIVVQRAVPVLESDTVSSLSDRIRREEHLAYPEAIRLLADDRLAIEGQRVRILPDGPEKSAEMGSH